MHILTPEELEALNSASTFDGLADVGIGTLMRMRLQHKEIVQICGPMSTGGCGDFQKNMNRFQRSISVAVSHGVAVFNQILFQDAMVRICSWKEGTPYPMEMLEVFYGRVLSSGHIHKGLFLSDWHTSKGSRWEKEFLTRHGIPTEDYPSEWIAEIE